jgi:molybdate transport system ATP-binding protein
MGLSVNLNKRINGFSLKVAWEIGNEIAVLFGYSGAGKSMTFQMIAGLMEPDEGIIRLDDKVFFDRSARTNIPPRKRSLGYVFQDLALFPHMTVRENILYGAHRIEKKTRDRKVREMLRAFHISGLADKYPGEISGGQKQRVAIARALIRRPDTLLLDEPFSALDNPVRTEMQQLLRKVRSEFNIPIVLITHDVFEAYTVADRIIVYSGGRIAQTGSPLEVFHNPVSSDVEALVNPQKLFSSLPAIGRTA